MTKLSINNFQIKLKFIYTFVATKLQTYKMKTLKLLIISLLACISMNGQTGPAAPSSGIWALIDTTYNVGTTTQGFTKARITLKNTTATKITGVQFRVFYDKVAFRNSVVSLVGSTTNLDLQYVTDSVNGFSTITLVYTGNSSAYTLANGETFELTLTHVASSIFNNLTFIDSLKFSGVSTFPQYASTQAGMDTTLGLYSYNGEFKRPRLNFKGNFINVNGSGAKNLTLSLEKKPKSGSTWSQVNSYKTNNAGKFSFSEILDTTFWDVRLAVKGDTMGVGNVVSTTDAQLINQWVLGVGAPKDFDFYAADVNGNSNITIADAFGVFGRVAGRITSWSNNVKDIKFFTVSQYDSIKTKPDTNYTATIPGVTNFYYNILPGQPDSVTYYVVVPGDANSTGYNMARTTPIEILINGPQSLDPQTHRVIDTRVEYDFPTNNIELTIPKLEVNEGNMVNIPVRLKSDSLSVVALQFGLKYDSTLLTFKGIYSSANAQKWLTYVNPNEGEISWGGYDPTTNNNALKNGDEIITFQFLALKPQADWGVSPLYTSNKFAGNLTSKDLSLTPSHNIIQVRKMSPSNIGKILDDNTMEVYPNPTTGIIDIVFNVEETTNATLAVYDMLGSMQIKVLEEVVAKGQFTYRADLGKLSAGVYTAKLLLDNKGVLVSKIIKQ